MFNLFLMWKEEKNPLKMYKITSILSCLLLYYSTFMFEATHVMVCCVLLLVKNTKMSLATKNQCLMFPTHTNSAGFHDIFFPTNCIDSKF